MRDLKPSRGGRQDLGSAHASHTVQFMVNALRRAGCCICYAVPM
jgi:hypothetical protein